MINSQWKKLIAEEESFKETVLAEHNRIEPPVTATDNVNSPAHYGKGKIECIPPW